MASEGVCRDSARPRRRRAFGVLILMGALSACRAPEDETQIRCSVPEDCPTSGDPCSLRVCGEGQCDFTLAPAGTTVSEPGVCPVRACGDDGALILLDTPCCGDGTCGDDETCATCPNDCPCCDGVTCPDTPETFCGNGICDPGETCTSCHDDCGTFCCGNGVCEIENGESCASCEDDCGLCPGDACGNGQCDLDETCSTCEDCACMGLSGCVENACQKLCPVWCDRCAYGTEKENNCPTLWDGAGDGLCDCGCQFFDHDCPDPCPSNAKPVYCAPPADTCCPADTSFCCPNPDCACCGPGSVGCGQDGCCE